MKLKNGNIWDMLSQDKTVIFVTTNAMLDSKDELVMGGGIALQAKKHFPLLPYLFGKYLKESGKVMDEYGLLIHPSTFTATREISKVCAFQTKINPWHDSTLDIIDTSVSMLMSMANTHNDFTFHLPFPGVGLGNLTKQEVLPLLECLQDNVIVWQP